MSEPTYRFTPVGRFSELCALLASDPPWFQVSYRDVDAEMTADFLRACEAVWCSYDLHFVVDEAWAFCSPSNIPLSFQRLIAAGRHRGISVSVASQRAAALHPLVRALSHRIVSFQQTEPRDLEWLRDAMGDDAESVRELAPYHALEWNGNGTRYLDPIPVESIISPSHNDEEIPDDGAGGEHNDLGG